MDFVFIEQHEIRFVSRSYDGIFGKITRIAG